MEKLVSVIVPVYNSEKYLEECIESILNQTYTNIELLLVDDGSSDDSGIICKRYAEKDERVLYFYKKNGGVSSTRNYGIEKSKGRYIVFIDGDDLIGKKAIFNLVNICSSKCVSRMKLKTEESGTYSRSDYLLGIIEGRFLGGSCGILYDRYMLGELRFDENTGYLEDTIFVFEYLMNNGIENICLSEHDTDVMYMYRENPNGITGHKGHVLIRLKNIEYSLNRLNEITGKKYEAQLAVKKLVMVEENFRLISDKKEIKDIMQEIQLERYRGDIFKYKLFDWLYSGKHYLLIDIYYRLRKIRLAVRRGIGKREKKQ